ncbi:MAG: endonuclease/exonuclease/phosphatase family protein [Jiangellales bacterium]
MRRLAVVVAGLGLLAGGVAVTGIDSTAGPTEARAAEALAADDSALSVSSASEPAGAPSTVSVVLTPMAQGEASATLMRAGDAPVRYGELAPGPYVLTASVSTPNVDLTSLACQPATAVQSLDLSTGSVLLEVGEADDVTCAVSTEQRGEIVVRHRTRPESTRTFAFTPSWAEALRLGHRESAVSQPLVPGTYSVSAREPKGWDLTGASCNDGSDPSAVGLDPGERVVCTFEATRRGDITVAATTIPSDAAQKFAFDASWSGKPVRLTDGAARTAESLVPDRYSLKPVVPKGWDLTGSGCDDGSRPGEIRLDPREKVTCAFEYTQRGRVVLAHQTDAAGPDLAIDVDRSWGTTTSVTNQTSSTSVWLRPGQHSVTPSAPSGWLVSTTTCDDGSDPAKLVLDPGETITCTFAMVQPEFTVASFNVLGHSHTERGGHSPSRPSGPARMGATMEALRSWGVDVVGLQEFQPPQLAEFVRQSGGEFALYPSPGSDQRNKQNSVAWRTSEFSLVEGRAVMIPYFKGNLVPMPLVKLRHNESGLEIYVMSVHNAASIRQLGDQSRWRVAARNQQIALTNDLLNEGIPFFMTGDMNERESYFCPYTASGRMHAAAGGSRGGACQPPPPSLARIDWVFGSDDVEFVGYRLVDDALINRASDHPLVVAEARYIG